MTELGRRVGLSQPATTRMAEGLEGHGLLRRESSWANWAGLHLTGLGVQAARSLLVARQQVLNDAVETLEERERAQLDALLGKLLAHLCQEPGDADRLCRLCDRVACVARGEICPVGEANRQRCAATGHGTEGDGTADDGAAGDGTADGDSRRDDSARADGGGRADGGARAESV